jgi:hypothetical protein
MDKTSVYLTQGERRRLAWLASAEGVSQAEIVRRAIAAYEPRPASDRRFELAGSFDGPGTSVADELEEDLLAGFGR